MRHEWLIGLRYLAATRNEAAPSVITLLSVLAVSIGTIALIVVLSVMGGFEGDLRNKILGTRAHVLVSGPDMVPIEDVGPLLTALDGLASVEAVSPFVESELLITSPTQYSAVVIRGVDLERVQQATDLEAEIVDGQLNWLRQPDAARMAWLASDSPDITARRDLDRIRVEAAELEARIAAIEADRAEVDADSGNGSGSGAETAGTPESSTAPAAMGSGEATPRPSVMPPLPAPRHRTLGAEGSGSAMPGLPGPRRAADSDDPAGDARTLPGIVLGSELFDSLSVAVGEAVEIINPDGPVGPTGPTPVVRRYRVVGVFHSGLFEYDNRYAYVLIDEARDFLMMGPQSVSGVELRALNADHAGVAASEAETALAVAGLAGLEVRDWMDLNSTLFAALMLEKFVMGGIMMVIVMVASFAIICVLIMVVIQRGAEIAILRSMGATRGDILRIFVVQGGAIGAIGTAVGGLIGIAIALSLQVFGFPLDPEVYYIDRLPVEIDWFEVVAVLVGALVISLLATLYPSVQASRLDPAGGLRYE